MLKPIFLLLFFGLHEANAICFRNTTTTVRKEVLDRPETVDEYHCKIICVEKTECLSFTFPTPNECVLLGKQDHDGMCMKPYQEWIKKTKDVDCPDIFAQPDISEGYVPNPAIANKATVMDNVNLNDWRACTAAGFLDTTLPDNTHQLQFMDAYRIEWDAKLGSWICIKQSTIYPAYTKSNATSFIRAARCYRIDDLSLFADTTTCGGELPTISAVPANYVSAGKVERYGQLGMCSSEQFIFLQDYIIGTNADGSLPLHNWPAERGGVICIDGAWAHGGSGVYKILKGVCGNRRNG